MQSFMVFNEASIIIRAAINNEGGEALVWNHVLYDGDLVIDIPANGTLRCLKDLNLAIANELLKTIPMLNGTILGAYEFANHMKIASVFDDEHLSTMYTESNWQTMLRYTLIKGGRLHPEFEELVLKDRDLKLWGMKKAFDDDWIVGGLLPVEYSPGSVTELPLLREAMDLNLKSPHEKL